MNNIQNNAATKIQTAFRNHKVRQSLATQNQDNISRAAEVPNEQQVVVTGFGSTGQETGNKIADSIREYNQTHDPKLTVSFANQQFIIGNSQSLSKKALEKILAENSYSGWKPNVENSRNETGNLVVSLISSSFYMRQTLHQAQPLLGVTSQQLQLMDIPPNSNVLDVGSGSGIIARRMREELGCNVSAIEPGTEASNSGDRDPFVASCNELGPEYVEKLTLQEAVSQEKYQGKFDAVTVHKYNVPLAGKTSFCESLAIAVDPDGVVYVPSVERERCFYDPTNPGLFLVPELEKFFDNVSVQQRTYGHMQGCNDGIITCRNPKNTTIN
ncbi:MAG: class I SAM-dependent methyltransferase [Candidatus Margulisiibacteriota bacterium]|nr:class I SAM-dependent methyltransferase [Candidatus Margulisiibacteriota bacterium]